MNGLTTEEKLRHFEEASLQRAREQSKQMLEEYKASLDQIEKEHKEAKDRQAMLKIKAETISLKRAKNMALSKKRLEIKRHIIKKHNILKEKLSAEVKIMLEEYMATPGYQELLIKQLKDILAFADGSPVTIYIDPADAPRLSSLTSTVNMPLTLSEYSFLGGTRAVIEDRNVLIDNSFMTLLGEEMEKFSFNGGALHE